MTSLKITVTTEKVIFPFKKSKTQKTPPSWVFFCDEKMSSQLQFSQFKRIFKLSLVQHTWLKQSSDCLLFLIKVN